VRDRVEIDYAKRLTFEEQSWLASFNEAEYGSNPDCLQFITGKRVSVEEKRRLWREIKRYERDGFGPGPRINIDEYFLGLHLHSVSNEDVLIEAIDNELEIEMISLENVKFLIRSKSWIAA
jgi:hypothetical protein